MAHIIVLGAGVVGITTAWQLCQAGFDVTVIEREQGAGLQTSFANGGQISVSHATPWANPSTPKKAIQWLRKEDAPLLFRWQRLLGFMSDNDDLSIDWDLWRWGWQFLQQCNAKQADKNLIKLVKLGLYSRQILKEVREQTKIDYDCLTKGIMHFYTNQQEFANAQAPTERMQQLGCDREIISVAKAIEIEPALSTIADKLVGATFTTSDESGDAKIFTQKLAELCQKNGVKFLFSHTVKQLIVEKNNVIGVEILDNHHKNQQIFSKGVVLCLGSYSPHLLKPLGIYLPIYPAKGYSATYPVLEPNKTPYVSLIDDEFKLVYSRLGERLRVAGTAEFNGFNLALNTVRCQAITRRVEQVFGNAVDLTKPNYWTGLRPMTPSNVPIIGQISNRFGKIEQLYLNTGHGTLGWTHSNGSAKIISDMIQQKSPEIDMNFIN